ncbi:MAG: hypothetical protein K6357_03495 [Elusimicrobiota bacterium]
MRKFFYILTSVIFLYGFVYSQEQLFDFDGSNKQLINILSLKENKQSKNQFDKYFNYKRIIEIITSTDTSPKPLEPIYEVVSPSCPFHTFYYEISPTSNLRVRLVGNWNPPCLQCSWDVNVKYENLPLEAGHHHNNPPPPPLTRLSGETLPNPQASGIIKPGEYIFDFKAPKYATTLQWNTEGHIYGGKQRRFCAMDIIYVRIKGLVEISTGTGYELVGKTDIHPFNHWVIPEFRDDLMVIGKLWKSICPTSAPLYYNDASLPWGGLFDIYGNWNPPHLEHNTGIHIDISKRNIKKGNREKALKTICQKAIVYSEGDATNEKQPHYHVIYKEAPQEILEILEKEYKYTLCCSPQNTSNIPQKCINLESGGIPIEEDEEGDCL